MMEFSAIFQFFQRYRMDNGKTKPWKLEASRKEFQHPNSKGWIKPEGLGNKLGILKILWYICIKIYTLFFTRTKKKKKKEHFISFQTFHQKVHWSEET